MNGRTLTDAQISRALRAHLPERAYPGLRERILDATETTTQQRAFPWFFGNAPIAIAAAAALLVALLGYNLLPRTNNVGNPATPVPTATPTAPAPLSSELLPAGSYTVTNASFTLVPYTFSVPAGWIRDDGGARKGDDALGHTVRMATWILTHVYADSCHWTGTLVPVTDKAGLVAALTAQQGHTRSAPVETTLGGLAATKITFTLDAAFDVATCDATPSNDRGVRLWPDPGPDESGGWRISPGETTTVYAIEAKGRVMVVVTVQHRYSPPADVAALQQILDSVVFQP